MRKSFYLILFINFWNCDGLHTNKKLINDYYLVATDSEDQLTISKKFNERSFVGVIPSTIVSYSIFEEFILAKQSEYNFDDKSFSEMYYYILNTNTGKKIIFSKESEFNKYLINKKILNIHWSD